MMYSLIDVGRLWLAVAACGLVIALPGRALARFFDMRRSEEPLPRTATEPLDGIVVGLAILPVIDSLVTRIFRLDAALALTMALAAGAIVAEWRDGRPARLPSPRTLALLLAWFALVAIEWIDFDWGGKLFQPFTVIDAVKHAATTQAILETGAPPRDPFFLRPEHASYYYFFYTLAALAQRLCFGLIDARAAVGGAVFWTGIGIYGLVRLALERSGLVTWPSRRPPILLLAVLAASGLDILGVVRMGLLQGTWIADPVSWNEQIAGWLESLLWVPHHLVGLIASILGLVALSGLTQTPGTALTAGRSIALAALCLASALGLSIWVTLGLVTTVALWSVLLVVERRWRAFGLVVLVGALAILIAAPQIVDLRAGRASTGMPAIVPTIRAFTPVDGLVADGPWRLLARLVALPVNYFAGFGVFVSGTLLLWKTGGGFRRTEFGRLLVIAAFAGLALGAFLKSTLFNNDLGWRVVLFPLFAGTVWTIAALDRCLATPIALPAWRRVPVFLAVLLVLGWATSLYALVNLRAYPWLANEAEYRFIGEDPLTERALRAAYEWADHCLPSQAVLQHDPLRARAFAFALYGRHPTAVADAFGSLFGANPAAVDARIEALAPVFRSPLPDTKVRAVAQTNGIDDLVVTVDDPVWFEPGSFVWHLEPVYASPRVRILPVGVRETPSPKLVGAAEAAARRRNGAEAQQRLGS